MKKMPLTLFVTLGAPGSGKSYFAERFCKEYGFVHLRSDEIRKYVFPNPTYSSSENKQLFHLIDFIAQKFLVAGVSVFYDANFTKRITRTRQQRVAKKYRARYAVLWVQTPILLAIKRANSRNYHPVDENVVRGLNSEIELPKNEPVIIIYGTKSYRIQKLAIQKYFPK
ncbi:MAG TPA: ATP-binding protein [Candidatus Paceibacterota bacterium]